MEGFNSNSRSETGAGFTKLPVHGTTLAGARRSVVPDRVARAPLATILVPASYCRACQAAAQNRHVNACVKFSTCMEKHGHGMENAALI